MPSDDGPLPVDLSHAGSIVDKAVEYMIGQNIGSLAIASALLGGSMALLARTMSDDAIMHILQNAIDSVRRGELAAMHGEARHGDAHEG